MVQKMTTDTFQQDKSYLLDKFKKPVFNSKTGLDNESVKTNLMALAEKMDGLPHPVIKAKAFEYVTQNVQIDVNPHDWFVGFGCWNRNDRLLNPLIWKWEHEVNTNLLEKNELLNE